MYKKQLLISKRLQVKVPEVLRYDPEPSGQNTFKTHNKNVHNLQTLCFTIQTEIDRFSSVAREPNIRGGVLV